MVTVPEVITNSPSLDFSEHEGHLALVSGYPEDARNFFISAYQEYRRIDSPVALAVLKCSALLQVICGGSESDVAIDEHFAKHPEIELASEFVSRASEAGLTSVVELAKLNGFGTLWNGIQRFKAAFLSQCRRRIT